MESRYYLTCLWPGLSELWWRGRLSALPAAIAFAVAVNAILVTRYQYPEWIPSSLVSMAFWVGLIAWGFYVIRSARELPKMLAPRRTANLPDQFPEARTAYLRGNWSAAEEMLTEVLGIEPRDPPALLLLAGVYRHTDRLEAAEILLQEIVRLEGSGRLATGGRSRNTKGCNVRSLCPKKKTKNKSPMTAKNIPLKNSLLKTKREIHPTLPI